MFSSLTSTSPSPVTKQSTRAIPSHSVATNASTETSCTRAITSAGMRGGTIRSMPPSSYFAEKSYQSAPSNPCATISPGSDAIGVRLPSTPHSTSIPSTFSSISTLSSWRRAVATAGSSSSAARTLEMPTDEPRRAGLTKTGYSKGWSIGSPSRIVTLRVTGIPRARSTAFARSLSMQTALAATPAPT